LPIAWEIQSGSGHPSLFTPQALFPTIDGGQPQAAHFDRKAKERGTGEARQIHQQAVASAI